MEYLAQFSLFIILCTLLTYTLQLTKKQSQKLPPGPPKLPIIGNLQQLLLKTTLPHHRLAELSKKYGRVMQLQMGEISTIIVSEPDMTREVMKTHDDIFCNRPILMVAKEVFYDCTDIGLAPYGEYWRNVRRISVLELFSVKRVQEFRPIRVEEVTLLVTSLAQEAGLGSVVNLSQKFFFLACDIMSRAAFSTKRDEQGPFRALLTGVTETCTGFCAADLFPSVKFLHTISGMKSKFQKLIKETDRIFEPIIEEHKLKKGNQVEDLVDVLLKHHKDNITNTEQFSLTTDNIKGVIMELLGGGSENSSSTIERAMSELLRNPEKMKKAQAEVREIYKELDGAIDETKLNDLKYLKLVIKETLRLHPPVPLLAPRESMERCKIPPYDIPNKTRVIINAWAMGRDPKYWDEPERFNPERFENSSIDFNGNHFELIPFGSGRRKCPGIALGISIVELPLSMMLYHFDWKLPYGMSPEELDMDETLGLTRKRKNPLRAIPTLYSCSQLKY